MQIISMVVTQNITAFEIFMANLNDMLVGWCRCYGRQLTTVFVSSSVLLTRIISVFNYLSLFIIVFFSGVIGAE